MKPVTPQKQFIMGAENETKSMQAQTGTYHLDQTQLQIEAQQIEEAKKDPKAFGVIYDKYYLRIFRFIFQRVASEDTAAEITSMVFAKALQSLHKYQFKGLPFGAWLFRVAQNELNQSYRKKKAQKVVNIKSEHLEGLFSDEQDEDQEDREQAQYQKEQLLEALRELKPEELELIEMRFFEQRAFREIGEILDITENNAKVKTFRVVKKLRKLLT